MPLSRYLSLIAVVLIAAVATLGTVLLLARGGSDAAGAALPLVGLVALLLRWLVGRLR